MKRISLIYVLALLLCHDFLFGQSTVKFGMGNWKNVNVSSSASSQNGLNTLQSPGFLPNQNAASRFLNQATLGTNRAKIQSVSEIGIHNWLDQQLNMPSSFKIQSYLSTMHQMIVDSVNFNIPGSNFTKNNYDLDNVHFDISWFQGSMTANDELRWKVGLALSEIFVVSRTSSFGNNPHALASYYDMLMNNAFGNYRTLIDSISYHPAMAVYLTYMNNHATDEVLKIYPDENYAREIMQLFSIGLNQLNIDGTEKKDGNNNSIPTYNNDDIAGLAKVFTGLGWADARYLGERLPNKWSYTKRLKFFPKDSSDKYIRYWASPSSWRVVDGHEPGTKTFLGNTIVSRPVIDGEQDIQDALNIIFNHPNVGPFLSRRLIQRLVMSNPSPQYIARVATVFNNNGSGVRGDLKAVIKAIFLDDEARECNCVDKQYSGALKEPFVRYMNIVKGLELNSTTGIYRNSMRNVYEYMEQLPLYSPTVFNFFSPDFQPDGILKSLGKYAPEFQSLNSLSYTAYFNALNRWIIQNNPLDYYYLFSGEDYKAEIDPSFDFLNDFVLTKDNRLKELLDKYNLVFAHGSIKPENIEIIKNAIKGMPLRIDSSGNLNSTDATYRLRSALYLILSSPDYLINR